jgi:hypothetical protein
MAKILGHCLQRTNNQYVAVTGIDELVKITTPVHIICSRRRIDPTKDNFCDRETLKPVLSTLKDSVP